VWTKRTIFVSVLVSILSLTAAFAQSRTTRTLGTQDNNLITLDFTQGTLADYVREIVQAKKGKVTIIIDSTLEDIEVPSANLRGVTLSQALEWIPKTANARQQGLALQTLLRPGEREPDSAMFLFTTTPTTNRPGSAAEELQVRTFALSWATDAVSGSTSRNSELVKTAVQDALSIQGPTAKQPVHYNPQTGVLTVRGTSRDINIASQVMTEMRRVQQQNTLIEQLQTELADLKATISALTETGEKQVK
jgi:hypothetical protein